MFAYATVGCTNFEASLQFFDASMQLLGYKRVQEYLNKVGWLMAAMMMLLTHLAPYYGCAKIPITASLQR